MSTLENQFPSDKQGELENQANVVALRTHVEIELIDSTGTSERLTFDLVPDEQADFYSGLLGESTPLAQAILGQVEGSLVPYLASDVRQVRIMTVGPSAIQMPEQAATRRKAAAQKALKQAERTNAMIFATSVEGKWGDYDADGMMENWD
jgi:hypothetical protein